MPAQPAAEWMSHPAADDSSEVWFRRTFVGKRRPHRASVRVATTGRFVLYVNGRNVSTALYMPQRGLGDTSVVSLELDVARFMRRDSNTIAVLYCPQTQTRRQVTVDFWGECADGTRFDYGSAQGWVCRKGAACLQGTGEEVDGRLADVAWSHADVDYPLWLPVDRTTGQAAWHTDGGARWGNDWTGHGAACVRAVLRPRFFDPGSHSAVYDFSPGFYGLVRVTLRGARRGHRLRIGNTTYTCSGEMDEQAYCRFAPSYMRRVEIAGDDTFQPEQVQDVEAVCM